MGEHRLVIRVQAVFGVEEDVNTMKLFSCFQIFVQHVSPFGSTPFTVTRGVDENELAGFGANAVKVELLCVARFFADVKERVSTENSIEEGRFAYICTT